MSKIYAMIIQFVLLLTAFYRLGAQKSNVYKRDVFVMSWRFHNRAWQPQRHDRLPETSGTLWIHRGALTNQPCSLATGCGIILRKGHSNAELWYCPTVCLWNHRHVVGDLRLIDGHVTVIYTNHPSRDGSGVIRIVVLMFTIIRG